MHVSVKYFRKTVDNSQLTVDAKGMAMPQSSGLFTAYSSKQTICARVSRKFCPRTFTEFGQLTICEKPMANSQQPMAN